MRAFKWVGVALVALVGVIVLAVALTAMLFDPNKYKGDIERMSEEKLGRKLTLEGDLKLSFFPWLAVQVGNARLGERPGFGDQPFVSVEQARLSIRLLPLFSGSLEIGDVRLDKPSIHLVTDEHGRHNWSDLSGEEKPAAETKSPTNAESGPVKLRVAGLQINNANLLIEDRKAKSRTAIKDFSLTTGAISSANPFDLKIGWTLEQDQRPPMPMKMSAKVTADFDGQRHRLQDFSFETRWFGSPKSEGVPVSAKIQSLDLDLRQQTLAVDGLALDFGPAKVSGTLAGKSIMDAPQFTGQIKLSELSPRDLMKAAAIQVPVTRDADALKRLSFQASLESMKNSVTMRKLELKLDDSTASGELAVADLDTKALRFDLALDRIDFDRYLPPPEKKEAVAESKQTAPTPIPVDLLRALNARGDLKIGDAKFSGMRLTKLHLGVNAQGGNVQLAPTDATVYGGDYRGSMAIDASGKVPRLTLESHATNVDFAPLMKDVFDTQHVSGHGAANVKVNAIGADTLAMQKSLGGNLDFNVTNGAFEGTDLWFEIRRARALLHGEAPPTQSGAARTPFTSCKGTGVIRDGVMTNNDLDVAMQYLKVSGQGTVDVVKSTLDYRLNAQVLRMADNAAADLVDAEIPVKITGSLSSPTVRPDIEGLVKARAKQELDKQKDKLREKLQDKLKDILGGKG